MVLGVDWLKEISLVRNDRASLRVIGIDAMTGTGDPWMVHLHSIHSIPMVGSIPESVQKLIEQHKELFLEFRNCQLGAHMIT